MPLSRKILLTVLAVLSIALTAFSAGFLVAGGASSDEAREYLLQSDAEQAPAILALLDEDPEGYRESVLDAPIN